MQAKLMQEAMQEDQDFPYGIAKISQGLRKFSKDCENFAMVTKFCNGSKNFTILAKFSYVHIFAMIAKICYDSGNALP